MPAPGYSSSSTSAIASSMAPSAGTAQHSTAKHRRGQALLSNSAMKS
jgi:hypothetical protein